MRLKDAATVASVTKWPRRHLKSFGWVPGLSLRLAHLPRFKKEVPRFLPDVVNVSVPLLTKILAVSQRQWYPTNTHSVPVCSPARHSTKALAGRKRNSTMTVTRASACTLFAVTSSTDCWDCDIGRHGTPASVTFAATWKPLAMQG